MTTVLDIIVGAMQDIGAIAIEEPATDAEANYGLAQLNNLVETWNTESLMVYNIFPTTFAYVAGQASYTYGIGGNFNAARPVRIEEAYNRSGVGTNQVDYPIYVTSNYSEYADIITKQIQTVLPTVMYYDGNYPLQTCYFWPVPIDNTYAPVLWSWGVIDTISTIDEVISLPPGYKRALQKNLAIEIAPAYGREPSQNLVMQAVESKAQLKRINYTVDTLDIPAGIPGAKSVYALPQFLQGS